MNYTQKILSVLLVVFVLPGLFLLLVCRPRAREYSRLQAKGNKLNHEIMEAKQEINHLPDTMREIDLLRHRLAKLKRQYPHTIEPFYEQISATAKKVGLDILSMISVSNPIRMKMNRRWRSALSGSKPAVRIRFWENFSMDSPSSRLPYRSRP